MTIQGDNINVRIDKSGVMATSASITSRNSLTPVIALNNKGTISQAINGPIQNTFDIEYWVETDNDPSFNKINFLKTGYQNYHFDGTQVAIAGITGDCYLTSYRIKVSPNEIIKAQTTYISFLPLTGYLQKKETTVNYNTYNSTGLGHGFTTLVTNTTNYNSPPTFELNYEFSADWQPVYSLGNIYPIQVNLLGGKEIVSLVREIYTGINPSGQILTGYLNITDNDPTIKIYELSFLQNATTNYPIKINISGAQINNISVETKPNDIVRVTTTSQKYY